MWFLFLEQKHKIILSSRFSWKQWHELCLCHGRTGSAGEGTLCGKRAKVSFLHFFIMFPDLSCYLSISENIIALNSVSLPFCHSTLSLRKTDLQWKYHLRYYRRKEVWRWSQGTSVTFSKWSCLCCSSIYRVCVWKHTVKIETFMMLE